MSFVLGTLPRYFPHQLCYPERKLTMEEMLCKFIEEGKREHEETEIFIKDFRTTNELLFREQNNLLIELEIGVYELGEVINDVLISKNDVKGITTRGGKITEILPNKETEPPNNGPSEQGNRKEVVVNKEPEITLGESANSSTKPQQPPVPSLID